jgi:hypothetical protein
MLRSREVIQMCQAGEARQARKMLADSLFVQTPQDQRIKKRLLENLFYVELHLGRLAAASQVLNQRRALGYSKTHLRMDAAFNAAALFAKQNKAEQARSELLGLIRNPKLLQWHGALKALNLYVEVEKECRDSVEQVLERASAAAVLKLGIRLESGDKKAGVREIISAANKMYRSASRTYSQLLIRGLNAASQHEHRAVMRDLRTFVKLERVGFFRILAKEFLGELVGRRTELALGLKFKRGKPPKADC